MSSGRARPICSVPRSPIRRTAGATRRGSCCKLRDASSRWMSPLLATRTSMRCGRRSSLVAWPGKVSSWTWHAAALVAPQLPQPSAPSICCSTGPHLRSCTGTPQGCRDFAKRCSGSVAATSLTRRRCGGRPSLPSWRSSSGTSIRRRRFLPARSSSAVRAVLSPPSGRRSGCGSSCSRSSGELAAATQLADEAQTFADAIGTTLQPYGPLMVAAWRGREHDVMKLVDATLGEAAARGEDEAIAAAHYALAVLYNGSSRFEAAITAAAASVPPLADGQTISNLALVELIEASARSGQVEQGAQALRSLVEMTQATGTDWALGVEARSQALLAAPAAAEDLHLLAIEHLSRTRLRGELARGHLVYGEWLRRMNRRVDGRGNSERRTRCSAPWAQSTSPNEPDENSAATGETVRGPTVSRRPSELTPQEAQIARLAAGGTHEPRDRRGALHQRPSSGKTT